MKTPIYELLEHVQKLKSNGQEIDTNGLEDWLISVGVPKEKEQFKEAVIEAYKLGSKEFFDLERDLEQRANDHFQQEYGY